MQLLITTAHLDRAIEESSVKSTLRNCVVAVAARDLFGKASCGYSSITDEQTGTCYQATEPEMYQITRLFDGKEYDKVREKLPLTLTLVKQ